MNPWGEKTKYFYELDVDTILQSVDAAGVPTSGWCLPYFCLENRVYEIGIDERHQDEFGKFLIGKFYRPGRWSKEQIQEEHDFLWELKDQDVPVIAPIKFEDGSTLKFIEKIGIYFCLFPKVGGRNPDIFTEEQIEVLGRSIARIHQVGASKEAIHRIKLNPASYAQNNAKYLVDSKIISPTLESSYVSMVDNVCNLMNPLFENVRYIRVHGDCHLGNLLYRDQNPSFVDFDDFLMGPSVQDFWLLFAHESFIEQRAKELFLSAYDEIRTFDRRELKLIEALRTLRLIHYSTWIAKRIEDPVFKRTFDYFGTEQYWGEQISDLREQYAKLESICEAY